MAGGVTLGATSRPPRLVLLLAVAGTAACAVGLALAGAVDPGFGVAAGLLLFSAGVLAFAAKPHVAIAVAIPYFALLPTLKLFVSPLLGGSKDALVLAALVAAGVVFARTLRDGRPTSLDTGVLLAVSLLLLLYFLNLGGMVSGAQVYGPELFHGIRLAAEPMALLVAGMVLPQPRRTLRWAAFSLAATGVAVSVFGIVQQALGIDRLMALGYRYGQEVREIDSQLRSFGTLDDPFAYAVLLLLSAAVVLFGWQWRSRTFEVLAVLGCGLVASFSRSAALIALALVGLAVARRGHRRLSIALALPALVGAAVIVVTSVVPTSTLGPGGRFLPLEARDKLWAQAVGDSPSAWILGAGVGTTGTASQRASEPLLRRDGELVTAGTVVDSSYVATVSDVGLIGLAILLALFGRLIVLARRMAAADESSGWIALGLLTVLVLDALSRETFAGFPVAYIGMLLVGVALASRPAGSSNVGERLYHRAKRAQRRWLIADYEDLRLRENWLRHDRAAPFDEVVVPVAPDTEAIRSVLVFKPDEIGDAVYALPAVAELRRQLPEARFFLLCRALTAPLYERSGLFDEIGVVELGSRTRPSLRAVKPALKQLSVQEFDLAVFLRTNPAGFRRFLAIPARARLHALDPRLRSTSPYQAPVSRWGDVRAHQALQHLQIVSVVTGREYSIADVRFPPLRWDEEDRRANALAFERVPPQRYLVVHPFAKVETRRYPNDYWPVVLDGLRNALGMPILAVGGPDDPRLDDRPGLVQMQGRLSLTQTAFLISRAAGFVGNLSGPAHLSAALGTRTVTLMSGNSLPVEWAPLGDSLVVRADVPCSPCHRDTCPGYGLACLRAMTPERVLPEVVRFLDRRQNGARADTPVPTARVNALARLASSVIQPPRRR